VWKSTKSMRVGMCVGNHLFFRDDSSVDHAKDPISSLHDKIHVMRDKDISEVQLP
jgi:hypothetical protein